jgi:hypothetical protein
MHNVPANIRAEINKMRRPWVARRSFKLAPALAEPPQQTDRQKDQSNRPVPQRAIHLKRC